jgi:aminopeptidase N
MADGQNASAVSTSAAKKEVIYLRDYSPSDYAIHETKLTFDIYEEYTQVTSCLALQKTNHKTPVDSLFLHGENLELESVAINGVALQGGAYKITENGLVIAEPPTNFELEIVTRIKPQNNLSLEGLYLSNGMYCTQCEAEGFRRITYYLDRPDVMSIFTVRVIADRANYPVLLSNGNRVAEGVMENGRHWVEWYDPFKKPCYLFALVAGKLDCIEDSFTTQSGREVVLQIYVENKDLNKCDHAMRSLKNAMRWDEQVYGREYDLDLYMIVAVDFFNMGAMENKGLNIFNTSCVLAHPLTQTDAAFQRVEAVIAHEYFHNWSGNRVTCRDWFQLSLKEGFTVFRDASFSADMNSATVKRIEDVNLLRAAQFAEDAGPMAHPIRPESFIEISNFYTLTIYEKGAEVIHMLHQILGAEDFRTATDLYFNRHDGQAVTCEDFVVALEDASGVDLKQFRLWYSQAGTPKLNVSDAWDEKNGRYTLTVAQQCDPSPGQKTKAPFYMPVNLALLDDDGVIAATEQTLIVSKPSESWCFDGLESRPTPSLLRGFSAPVKLYYDYSFKQMLQLMQCETDGFMQWDMSRRYLISLIKLQLDGSISLREASGVERINEYAEALRLMAGTAINQLKCFNDDTDSYDYALLAELLKLPSYNYIVEQFDDVDMAAICAAVEQLQSALSQSFAVTAEQLYEAAVERLRRIGQYRPFAGDIALRSLKNCCLAYRMFDAERSDLSIAAEQYNEADNMTDQIAVLHALTHSASPAAWQLADELLLQFYQRWSSESLVVNQWLSLQVTGRAPDRLAKIRALQTHQSYDETNPNKVRALVGAYCAQNLPQFHDASGRAYQMLADEVIRLDQINPQLAARLLAPLTAWRRFAMPQRQLMSDQLRRIATLNKLSADVYEVTKKALGPE